MHIETETCQQFLTDIRKASDDLLELSDFDLIIIHSFNQHYKIIKLFNSIYIVHAICMIFTVVLENHFFQWLTRVLAIFIIMTEVYLLFCQPDRYKKHKSRLGILAGNIFVLLVTFMEIKPKWYYEFDED